MLVCNPTMPNRPRPASRVNRVTGGQAAGLVRGLFRRLLGMSSMPDRRPHESSTMMVKQKEELRTVTVPYIPRPCRAGRPWNRRAPPGRGIPCTPSLVRSSRSAPPRSDIPNDARMSQPIDGTVPEAAGITPAVHDPHEGLPSFRHSGGGRAPLAATRSSAHTTTTPNRRHHPKPR